MIKIANTQNTVYFLTEDNTLEGYSNDATYYGKEYLNHSFIPEKENRIRLKHIKNNTLYEILYEVKDSILLLDLKDSILALLDKTHVNYESNYTRIYTNINMEYIKNENSNS